MQRRERLLWSNHMRGENSHLQSDLGRTQSIQGDRCNHVCFCTFYFVLFSLLLFYNLSLFYSLIGLRSDMKHFIAPCGACRQFIAEFGPNMDIVLVKNKDEVKMHKLKEILPFIFDNSTLEEHARTNGVD